MILGTRKQPSTLFAARATRKIISPLFKVWFALFAVLPIGTAFWSHTSVCSRDSHRMFVGHRFRSYGRNKKHALSFARNSLLVHPDKMANHSKKRKSSRATGRAASVTTNADAVPYQLLMILSPAKTLNLSEQQLPTKVEVTKPLENLRSQRQEVVSAMKAHATSAAKLGALLKTSQKITSSAQEYWQDMSEDASSSQQLTPKPSIFLFNGAAYSGLDIDTMATKENLEYLQSHLRIVDPLYGWLRPMDEVVAYRLEMATKGVFSKGKTDGSKKIKLEDYWKPGILDCIEQEENDQERPVLIVNLASDEYSAAVNVPAKRIVKVVFKHGGRTIAVHAKRARGLMVRYMATTSVQSVDQLLDFNLEGYTFRPNESTYQNNDEDYFSIDSLGSLRPKASPPISKKAKSTKPSKDQPLTMVFDRPGNWTRPKT